MSGIQVHMSHTPDLGPRLTGLHLDATTRVKMAADGRRMAVGRRILAEVFGVFGCSGGLEC